jgi:hypothetical protein
MPFMMPGTWCATISDNDFVRKHGRLFIAQRLAEGRVSYLLEDGTWEIVNGEQAVPQTAGILIPYEGLDAVHEALERWKGTASHAATETKVLREWLEVERGRVDDLHYRALDRLIGLIGDVSGDGPDGPDRSPP